MKKTLASLMLASSALGSLMIPATSVFASVVDNGDGTQTITGQPNAQIEFKGQIGEIDPETADPTDPDVPGPGTDWIKVKLPTKVVYYSTSSSKHQIIDSPDYTVSNSSAYPVDVQLSGFVGGDGTSAPNIEKIGELSLKVGSTSIDLVKGSTAQTPNSSIFKLGTDPGNTNRQDNTAFAASNTFKITGTTASGADLAKLSVLNNKLNITLVGLDKDGNVPAPKA